MELYSEVSQATSKYMTRQYSTSFGLAARLLKKSLRPHIYNVYGLVRLADEVVDTYGADDASQVLHTLEAEVYAAIKRGYSTNLIVHAFAATARKYGISKQLIAPFFMSMQTDAPGGSYGPEDYKSYIHGSAEVVGLMCLRVFCEGDEVKYRQLRQGAVSLGSAFQKINFLRDLAEDYRVLGRYYFPVGSFASFDESTKRAIIDDIENDLAIARPAIQKLPSGARTAVATAATLYEELLDQLLRTPVAAIRKQRVRVTGSKKLFIVVKTMVKRGIYA